MPRPRRSRKHSSPPKDDDIEDPVPTGPRVQTAPVTALAKADHERALRPKRLTEFTGQGKVLGNLRIAITAAQQRKEPLDHILLSGPPGLGKTTLAAILANEMGVEMRESAASLLEKPGDLAGVLSSLLPNQVLFIDEIHALKRQIEEYLYGAMEDYRITVNLGEGPTAQTLTIPLAPFTLIGATTREGLLSAPFRSRFGLRERLELYSTDELTSILARSAGLLSVPCDEAGLRLIASRSRGTARIANAYLRRVRDVAQVKHDGRITQAAAAEGMNMLGVDEVGLCEIDRRLLACLALHGRPVGVKTIAMTVGEEEVTIEDTYEPWLIQSAMISKTPAGRVILKPGLEHCLRTGIITQEQLSRPLRPGDLAPLPG